MSLCPSDAYASLPPESPQLRDHIDATAAKEYPFRRPGSDLTEIAEVPHRRAANVARTHQDLDLEQRLFARLAWEHRWRSHGSALIRRMRRLRKRNELRLLHAKL